MICACQARSGRVAGPLGRFGTALQSMKHAPVTPGNCGESAACFHGYVPRDVPRDRRIERQVQARLRRMARTVGEDLERLRIDAAATKAEVAR